MLNDFTFKKQRAFLGLVVFFVLIAVDQLTKNLVGNVHSNFYFAFSLHVPIFLMYGIYFVGIAAIVVYLYTYERGLTRADLLAWLFILTGAISNLGERIILGYVRDWIYISNGVFNLADGYIILGIIILLTTDLKKK